MDFVNQLDFSVYITSSALPVAMHDDSGNQQQHPTASMHPVPTSSTMPELYKMPAKAKAQVAGKRGKMLIDKSCEFFQRKSIQDARQFQTIPPLMRYHQKHANIFMCQRTKRTQSALWEKSYEHNSLCRYYDRRIKNNEASRRSKTRDKNRCERLRESVGVVGLDCQQ